MSVGPETEMKEKGAGGQRGVLCWEAGKVEKGEGAMCEVYVAAKREAKEGGRGGLCVGAGLYQQCPSPAAEAR